MSASLVKVSDRRFKQPNTERRARKERRFQAELAARSTPALVVRSVDATPEAQKRGKRRGTPQKRLSKKRREKKRRQAAAQAPPRDVIRRPSPPSASSRASGFKLPPLAPPKVPSWTSTIPAENEPSKKQFIIIKFGVKIFSKNYYYIGHQMIPLCVFFRIFPGFSF